MEDSAILLFPTEYGPVSEPMPPPMDSGGPIAGDKAARALG
jgi:hypothetical protein